MNRVGAMAKYLQRSLSVSDLVVHGHCDSKFEAVRSGFVENFTQRDELGASVAVMYEGELVVDLWAGYGDANRTRPWLEDTLVNVWSVGKAMTALTLLHLLENRDIDVNSRVADHWPEFAQAGKEQITLAQAMSHQAGLCGIDSLLPTDAYFHWDLMTAAIANKSHGGSRDKPMDITPIPLVFFWESRCNGLLDSHSLTTFNNRLPVRWVWTFNSA